MDPCQKPERLKQPVIIDNRPGGGTTIGAYAVAAAPPDDYTFGWVISAHAINPSLDAKLPYEMTQIGYKAGIAAHPDVMSGRVPVLFEALPNALQHITSGKLKIIAVVADAPVAGYPQFPVLTGLLPAGATTGWNGIVVPARTPKAIVATLNTDIIAAVRSLEVQERFASLIVETITSTPEQFDAFIREDIKRWGDVVRRAGIKLDDR